MKRYVDVELIEPYLQRELWGTPGERWAPVSWFGNLVDMLPKVEIDCGECQYIKTGKGEV